MRGDPRIESVARDRASLDLTMWGHFPLAIPPCELPLGTVILRCYRCGPHLPPVLDLAAFDSQQRDYQTNRT